MKSGLNVIKQVWLTICQNLRICFVTLAAVIFAMIGYTLNQRFFFLDPNGYLYGLIHAIVGTPMITLPFYFIYRKEDSFHPTVIQLLMSKWKSLLIALLLLLFCSLSASAYQTFLEHYIVLYERMPSITVVFSRFFSCCRNLRLLIYTVILPIWVSKTSGNCCGKLQIRMLLPAYLIFAVVYLPLYILSDINQYELLYKVPYYLISAILYFLMTLTCYRAVNPMKSSES